MINHKIVNYKKKYKIRKILVAELAYKLISFPDRKKGKLKFIQKKKKIDRVLPFSVACVGAKILQRTYASKHALEPSEF